MKKIIAVVMSLIMAAGLAACAQLPTEDDAAPVQGSAQSSAVASVTDEQTAGEADGMEEAVTSITAEDGFENAGYTYYICEKTGTYEFAASGNDEVTWTVYLLDEEFEDAARYINQAFTPAMTNGGQLAIAEGQYIYVNCSSNAFSEDEADPDAKYEFRFISEDYTSPAQTEVAPAQFGSVITAYTTALSERTPMEELMDSDICYLIGMSYDDPSVQYGWYAEDLDGDNIDELLIGCSSPENPFMNNMVLGMYRMSGTGKPEKVFLSGERDRYYYAGDGAFAHEGSSSAFDSFEGTARYEDGKMSDTDEVIDPENYINPGYALFGEGEGEE